MLVTKSLCFSHWHLMQPSWPAHRPVFRGAVPGVRGSLASVLGSDQFLPTLFSGISKAILPSSYPAITATSVKVRTPGSKLSGTIPHSTPVSLLQYCNVVSFML